MTATSILAAAATIADHDAYVAFWSNEANITTFVANEIDDDDLIAAAQSGSYFAQVRIASDVAQFTKFEAMTDTQLHAEMGELSKVSDWNEAEGKFELGESDYAWHLISVIEDLLAFRRYTSPSPLAHNPFAALAA